MACLELPPIDLPTLPSPLSIEPPDLGTLSADATICCKLFSVKIPLSIPLGPLVINPGVIIAINQTIKKLREFKAALPLRCARE